MKFIGGMILGLLVGIVGTLILVNKHANTKTTKTDPAIQIPDAALYIPTTKPESVDKWNISSDENELDHSKRIAVSDSDFVLRCAPKFEGYVIPPLPGLGHSLHVTDGHWQTIRFRIDQEQLRTETWTISDSLDALFPPSATLRQIVEAKSLVLEYQPEYETKRTTTIDLSGLRKAVDQAGCQIPKTGGITVHRYKQERDDAASDEIACTADEIKNHNEKHPESPWPVQVRIKRGSGGSCLE